MLVHKIQEHTRVRQLLNDRLPPVSARGASVGRGAMSIVCVGAPLPLAAISTLRSLVGYLELVQLRLPGNRSVASIC